MLITKDNYREHEPEELSRGLSDGSMQIDLTQGIELAMKIIGYIADTIGERHLLRKRVEQLEAFEKQQVIVNEQILKLLNK